MRLYYKCGYDGTRCNKAQVQVVNGELIEPTNIENEKQFQNILSKGTIENSWDICRKCKGYKTITGLCKGYLAIET